MVFLILGTKKEQNKYMANNKDGGLSPKTLELQKVQVSFLLN